MSISYVLASGTADLTQEKLKTSDKVWFYWEGTGRDFWCVPVKFTVSWGRELYEVACKGVLEVVESSSVSMKPPSLNAVLPNLPPS